MNLYLHEIIGFHASIDIRNRRNAKMEQTKEVDMEDVAEIMNRINEVLDDIGFVVVGYDNTGIFLKVLIEKQ